MNIQDYMALSVVAIIVISAIVKVITNLTKPPETNCGCGKKCKKGLRRVK